MKTPTVLGVLALLAVSTAAAQTAALQSTSLPAVNQRNQGELVELSPFVVLDEADQGYRAQRTMVGSRSAKDLIDIPASIGIINQQALMDIGALSVHDALRYTVSGVTQNQTFNEDLNVRGFRAVTPLRNGIERSTNKSLPLYDVERIEVLKGPAAMLTGSNAGMGGNINYISRRPTHSRKGDIALSVNDAGVTRFQANVSGPARHSEDFKLDYRFTLGALQSNAPRGKPIEYDDQKFFGSGFVMYFGKATSLTFNGYYFINNDYTYLEDFLDITVPIDSFTGLAKAKFNRYSTQDYAPGRKQDAFFDIRSIAIDVTYLTKLTENGNLRAAYYYGYANDRRRNNRGITVRPDNYTLDRQDIRVNTGAVNNAFQLDYLHHLPLSWMTVDSTIGADGATSYTWMDQSITFMPALDTRSRNFPDEEMYFARFPNDAAYFLTPRPGTVGPPATRTRSNPKTFSYYFQENLTFWKDRLIFVGGLRWFKPGGTNENQVTSLITQRDAKEFKVHKYGIVFKVLPSLSIYATDAQNVFIAAFGRTDRFIANDQLGEPFRDSEGKLREVGLKFDRKVSNKISIYGSAALFKMEQTNIRTFGTLPSGQQGLIQSAKDSSEGWETDLGAQLKLAQGQADIVLTFFDGDSAIAADQGRPYVRQAAGFVPRKFSFFGKYSWTTGPLRGVRIGGGLETEADKRNGAHVLHHPLIADAFLGYTWRKNWDVQLNLSNLTDERYIIQVAANGLVQGSDTFRTKLTLRYRW